MAPGITGAGSGRPRPAPFVRHYGVLVPKELVPITVSVGNDFKDTSTYVPIQAINEEILHGISKIPSVNMNVPTKKVPLIRICYGRSGDEGDVVNIGIIAR